MFFGADDGKRCSGIEKAIMGLFDFLRAKKKLPSDLVSALAKIGLIAFPGGRKQMLEESAQLHALFRGRLSKSEARSLVTHTKAVLVISKDKSEGRIIQSILDTTRGKLTSREAKLAYEFFTRVSGELYAGGNGSSKAEAVVINATRTVVGVGAEYRWIEDHYGERDVDWMVSIRSHGRSDDGRAYETFHIDLRDGRHVEVVFDVSSFYLRF